MRIHLKSSPVEGRIMRSFSEDNIEGQLMVTCLRAEHDVWLRLLPKNDDNDSLFFNTGQNWEHMYPCLYKAGFMSLDKASGKVIINKRQWESFCLISDVRMQMGTYREKYDSRPQFFIAICDRLKYDSPVEQIKDGYSMPCSLPSNEDIELRRYFRVCAAQLFKGEMEALINEMSSSSSNDKPIESTKGGKKLQTKTVEGGGGSAVGTTPSKAPTDNAKLPVVTPNGLPMRKIYTELDFLCDRFEEEINFALALDMQKRPRLQRDGNAEIKICSEVQFDEAARNYTTHCKLLGVEQSNALK
jgi:hypothetical protein